VTRLVKRAWFRVSQDQQQRHFMGDHSIGSRSVKTVLILDSDVGFAFWCGHALIEDGNLALAALSVPDAIDLLKKLNVKLDALIVNPTMSGVKGFIERSRGMRAHVRVIAAIESPADVEGRDLYLDAVIFKPIIANDYETQSWLATLNSMLADNVLFV
jgi:hypothetical protein